jgi:hypothetical protein
LRPPDTPTILVARGMPHLLFAPPYGGIPCWLQPFSIYLALAEIFLRPIPRNYLF